MAAYTDSDRIIASKIAYSEEIRVGFNALNAGNSSPKSYTLREILDAAYSCGDPAACHSKYKSADEFFAGEGFSDAQESWSISAVYDNNSGMRKHTDSIEASGFYACIIETNADHSEAMLAFRGSESAADIEQLQKDWMEADLGLLNSTHTNQYSDAERFLLENRDLISKYKSVELTGHSLGGNLAEFSMIIAGRYGLGSNFTRCTSLDGPGFSNEFLKEYKDDIAKVRERLYRKKWSLVGSLLNDVPGETVTFGKVQDDPKVYANPFGRHALESLDVDETGTIREGKQDFIAFLGEKFSRAVDALPAPIGNALVAGIQNTVMYIATMTDEEKKKWGTAFILLTIATGGQNLVVLAAAAVKVIAVALVLYAVYLGWEVVQRVWDEIVSFAKDIAEKVWNWTQEKVAEFISAIIKIKDELVNAFRSITPSGIRANRYLSDHHTIRLHTDDLRTLAARIEGVNSRLSQLDSRMNGLYRCAKLTDLRELITCVSADLKICYSSRLRNCANYLKDTAGWFEEAERQIESMF